MMDAGPYRGTVTVPHICIMCLDSRSDGPMDCGRCRTPRSPISDDVVYQDMLAEAHRRTEPLDFFLIPGLVLTGEGRLRWWFSLKHRNRPATPLEDMTREELLDWLIPPKR